MPLPEQLIRDIYGLPFPDDFFRFRDFLDELPAGLLGETIDMFPDFPFQVAAGKPSTTHPEHPSWTARYYHDLPEFVTIFHGTTDGLHWGYFFDAPGEHPPVVASYWHSDTFQHALEGDSIFEAVRLQIEQREGNCREGLIEEPDEEDYQQQLDDIALIRDRLSRYFGSDRTQTGEDYVTAFGGSSWRKPVSKTWDGLGIVVKSKLFQKLSTDPFAGYEVTLERSRIEPLIAEAKSLLKQGFPGSALKFGRDLWVWANDFPECYELLDGAYAALGREPLRHLLSDARDWRHHCDTNRG